MKKTHIVLIIVIALAIGAIVSSIADASTYAQFSVAENNPNQEFQVVGELNKNKEIEYSPSENANLFSFYMVDKEGTERKVLFQGAKPQDFERSEQVVVTGKFADGNFHADKILMKCPSKYNDGKAGEEFTEVTAATN